MQYDKLFKSFLDLAISLAGTLLYSTPVILFRNINNAKSTFCDLTEGTCAAIKCSGFRTLVTGSLLNKFPSN